MECQSPRKDRSYIHQQQKVSSMKTRNLILIIALTVAVCLSIQQAVNAGGPGPSPSATIAGGATVRGVVKFEGKVPAAKPINMAADPSCAKQHPTPAVSQEIMTDGRGDLQNAIVFIADGLDDRTFDPPSQSAVIE